VSARRVAVTGLGVVAPLGDSVEELCTNLVAGRSGIRQLDIPLWEGLRSPIGARAGFRGPASPVPAFDGVIAQAAFWLEVEPVTDGKRALRERLARAYAVADEWRTRLSEDERRAADYLLVKNCGFPAYMGGAFSSAAPGI